MEPKSFDSTMRELEYFHSLRFLPGAWAIIRVDGRSFSKFTAERFEKPFDLKFHELMLKTTEVLLTELDGIYAFRRRIKIDRELPMKGEYRDFIAQIITRTKSI